MRRLIALSIICLSFATAVQAQDVCTTVIDLTRMFTTLEAVIDQGGTATETQISNLRTIHRRNNAFSVNYSIENSPLTSQRTIINSAFGHARTIQDELETHAERSSTAALTSTRASLHRALGVLGRLDCPPPVGDVTEPGAQTALPRSAEKTTAGVGIGRLEKLKWVVIAAAGVLLTVLGGFAFYLFEKRTASLTRRYDCDIATSYILPGPPASLGTGQIVDISRSGTKIGAKGTSTPKIGDRLVLHIGIAEFSMTVRWQNAFYFGGNFAHPLGKRAIKDLIGDRPRSWDRGQKRDRAKPAHKTHK